MPSCVVKTCRNHSASNKKSEGITFHRFPSANEAWKSDWVNIIRESRNESNWNPTKSSVICSVHFEENDLYTTKGGLLRVVAYAVPKKLLFDTSGIQEAQPTAVIFSWASFNKSGGDSRVGRRLSADGSHSSDYTSGVGGGGGVDVADGIDSSGEYSDFNDEQVEADDAEPNPTQEYQIEIDLHEDNYDVCKMETVEHTFDESEDRSDFVPANKGNMPEVNMFAVVQYITDNEKVFTLLDYPKLKLLTKNNPQLLTSIKVLQTESIYRIRGTVNFDRVTSHMCEIEYNIQTDIITSSECVCGNSPCEHVAAFIMCLAHKPTNKQTGRLNTTTQDTSERDTPQTSDSLLRDVKPSVGDVLPSTSNVMSSDVGPSTSTVMSSDVGPSTSTVMSKTHPYNVEVVDEPSAKRYRVSVETEVPVVPESSITVVPMPKDEDEPHKSKLQCIFPRKTIYTMWKATTGSGSERSQKIQTTLKQRLRDEEYIIDFSPIEQRTEHLCVLFDKMKRNMNKSEFTEFMDIQEVVELERVVRNRNTQLRDPLS